MPGTVRHPSDASRGPGGLVTHPDDLPPWTRAVMHPACGRSWPIRDVTVEDSDLVDVNFDKLWCPDCADAGGTAAAYGLLALRHVPVEASFPPGVAARGWAPLPHVLVDKGYLLDLSASERAFIAAVWRHQAGGGRAYPGEALLARETGLSVSTVGRVTDRLERRGLLGVRRARRHGRQLPKQYDLSRLWEALANLPDQPEVTMNPGAMEPEVTMDSGGWHSGPCEGTGVHHDPRPEFTMTSGPGFTMTSEVEPGQRERPQEERATPGAPTAHFEDDPAEEDRPLSDAARRFAQRLGVPPTMEAA